MAASTRSRQRPSQREESCTQLRKAAGSSASSHPTERLASRVEPPIHCSWGGSWSRLLVSKKSAIFAPLQARKTNPAGPPLSEPEAMNGYEFVERWQ